MGSFELDTIMLKLEKEDGITDFKESSTEIRELHDPKIFRMDAPYLASSERIHMGSDYFHHLFAHHETFRIFRSDHRMAIGFEPGEMIVVEKSGKGTHFEVGTKKPRKLVCEK